MNDKILGAVLGIVITLGLFVVIGITAAHNTNINEDKHTDTHMNMGMMKHMSGLDHEDWKHKNYHMGMMNHHMADYIDIENMDSDGDGFCDMCRMSIEECSHMSEEHSHE